MKYGVCNLSIVPGREEPSDKSEMVTQLLFGDHYKIIDERAKWSKVRNAYDKYECWIDKKQTLEITKEQYDEMDAERPISICTELTQLVKRSSSKEVIPVVMGSRLPLMNTKKAFKLGEEEYIFLGATHKAKEPSRAKIVEFAQHYLNAPYLWGGKSPFGIDCSGFSQLVYKMAGVQLPRDAYQQAEIGLTLSFVEEAQEGDLAFFDNNEGEIIHVGIIMKDHHILHASGKVRLDRLDHEGIYNADTKSYSHKLRLIKSIV